MIAFVEGAVAEIREHSLVISAGPVGLELQAPKPTLVKLTRGEAARLHTHLVVKEDSFTLYGFHEHDLLELFRHLISVGGVGPKLALAVLSTLPSTVIAGAILGGDAPLLASTPGVGKRTAERIVLELAGKLPEHLGAAAGGAAAQLLPGAGEDAVQALLALGYREGQVKQAVAELAQAHPEEGAEALIRRALGRLR